MFEYDERYDVLKRQNLALRSLVKQLRRLLERSYAHSDELAFELEQVKNEFADLSL